MIYLCKILQVNLILLVKRPTLPIVIGKVKLSTVGHRHSGDLLFPIYVYPVFHIVVVGI